MSALVNRLGDPNITRRQALHAAGAGAATLLGSGLLAACGSSSHSVSSAGKSASGNLTNVTDQLGWLDTSQWAGSYAAINNGYYRAEGIDEHLVAGGPNIIASSVVGAGHAMVGQDTDLTVIQAIAHGEPLVMFATITQISPNSIFSYPSKPITTLQQFAGKKIALPPATRPLLIPLLKKAGVNLSSVSFVPAANVGQFINHQVDGYWGFATQEGTVIQQQGIKFLITPTWNMGLKSFGNTLITTRDTLKSSRDLLVRYLTATIKGWEYAITYPDQMGKLTVDTFAAPGDSVKAETGQAVAQVKLIKNPAGIMRFTYPKMQAVIAGMLATDALTKPLKAADVMTTEILDAVYGNRTSIPI